MVTFLNLSKVNMILYSYSRKYMYPILANIHIAQYFNDGKKVKFLKIISTSTGTYCKLTFIHVQEIFARFTRASSLQVFLAVN